MQKTGAKMHLLHNVKEDKVKKMYVDAKKVSRTQGYYFVFKKI